jgi:hypothetical protein
MQRNSVAVIAHEVLTILNRALQRFYPRQFGDHIRRMQLRGREQTVAGEVES